jgi:hypothetical protein
LLAGNVVSNPLETHVLVMNVVCCAGRCLCDGPTPRPEETYRVCVCECVTECNQVNNNLLHISDWVGRAKIRMGERNEEELTFIN